MTTDVESFLRSMHVTLSPYLDERQRRLFVAVSANALGHGGIAAVQRATGASRSTISRGRSELDGAEGNNDRRVRRPGGGRRKAEEKDPELVEDLRSLLEPDPHSDPPLRWTSKSLRKLAEELKTKGHVVSTHVVGRLLREMGFSLQGTRKTKGGPHHPARNAQFHLINNTTKRFHEQGQPVIFVDTKKKELGERIARGQEWQANGKPVHDVPGPEKGKAPRTIYDIFCDEGWGNVGISVDTAEFAAQSIRCWWQEVGQLAHPNATNLLMITDCAGNNRYRVRLWQLALQRVANETGLTLAVMHFPPGTSKWKHIDNRMFSHITTDRRGRSLTCHEVVVNLIGDSQNRTRLRAQCEPDHSAQLKNIMVTGLQTETIQLDKSSFPGEWNYLVYPHQTEPLISCGCLICNEAQHESA